MEMIGELFYGGGVNEFQLWNELWNWFAKKRPLTLENPLLPAH